MRVTVDRRGSGPILWIVDDDGVTQFLYSAISDEPHGAVRGTSKEETTALVRLIVKLTKNRRLPTSPTGDPLLICDEPSEVIHYGIQRPCGHTWSDHDDDGCLWYYCSCTQPGERK